MKQLTKAQTKTVAGGETLADRVGGFLIYCVTDRIKGFYFPD